MMIEQNTNYAYKLKYMDNPTFDKVRDLSTKFYRELPQALQDELYEALNRGIDILDSEPQMTTYLYAFGKMHQAKLEYAFGKMPEEFLEQSKINIIDYGCGQALGTMCYADFLHDKGYEQKVKTITLIEPSEICLKRAALHVSLFFPDAEIITVNKKFDDLTQEDIVCDEGMSALHIFSNVLDLLSFEDLYWFSDLVKDNLKGYNHFICVGPYFSNSDKDNRMDEFCAYLQGDDYYSKSFVKTEFNENKAWTAHILCFSVGETEEDDISTENNKDDINNSIVDDCGVTYSKDRKRLLSYGNSEIPFYPIKEGTKVICDLAFVGGSLQQIIIPKSVKSIGKSAFENSSLQQIIIPDSIKNIGGKAFAGCTSLRQVILSNSATSIGGCSFWCCFSLQQVIIPYSVTSIGNNAFEKCSSLKHIVIPESVTSIGSEAFRDSGLSEIALPDSISIIEHGVFSHCLELRKVNIPPSVTRIKDEAFLGCHFLEQIVLPYSIKTIGFRVFEGCEHLKKIFIPKGSKERFRRLLEERLWEKLVEYSNDELADFISQSKDLGNLSTEVTYEDRVNEVADGYVTYSEDGDKLLCYHYPRSSQPETITIKEGTRIICNQAFGHSDDCKLKQVIIPDSVTHIGEKAFEDCKCLEQINIPDSILSIGNLAFKGCEKLKQITIPQSVKHIGDNPFITPALITSNSERFIIKNDMLIDLYEQRLICYLGEDTDVVIPETITTIGNYAFYDCYLEHVTIPDSVISIGDYAFAYCPLQNFVISKSILHIGKNPFDNCGVCEEIPPWESIPINIKSYSERFSAINDMLIDNIQHRLIKYFGNDSIIRIPEGITYIGDSAFSGCDSIEQIIIPDSVIGIGREAFGGCEKLCQINLPNGISTIEEGTFDCCFNLQQITIPNTVKSIGQWAFASCPITQINLPKSIEFIGWRIFQGCHSLKQIIIPKGTYEKIVGLLDESQSDVAAIIEQ